MFGRAFQRVFTIPPLLLHNSKHVTVSSRFSVLRNEKLWQVCRHPLKACFKNKKCGQQHFNASLFASMLGVFAYNNSTENINQVTAQQEQKIPSTLQESFTDYLKWPLLYALNKAFLFAGKMVYLIQITIRCSFLSFSFGPLLILYPLAMCSQKTEKVWFSFLLRLVTFAGPTFIKLGQWASTRRDLFSPNFCNILGLLHHDAACHPWKRTTEIMRRAFGESWQEWCKMETQQAVHSGCIGQVYKGHVDMGEFGAKSGGFCSGQELDGRIEVAIKVLHPGVMELVDLDLTIMKYVARFLSLIPGVEWLSFPDIVTEFEQLMKNQIDLKVEAHNLDLFNKLFSSDASIKFPSPIWPLVHSEVLIETFEDGIPVSHFTRASDSSLTSSPLKKHLAKLGISAILKMVFVNNFVHADLHPGNIIVQYKSDDETALKETDCLALGEDDLDLSRVQLVFLDAGIIASLSDKDLDNLHKVFKAIVTNQGDLVGELFLEHATANKCNQPEEFKNAMAALINNIHKVTLHLGKVSLHLGKVQVSGLLGDLFSMLMRYKVKLEGNFSSVMLAIMILEGLGRSLDPDLDIMREARPILLGGLYKSRRRSRLQQVDYQQRQ